MAVRKRMIDPSIWEDPSFNKLSVQARFIFMGLISNADDEGYFRAESGGIKRLLFGYDNITKEEIIIWLKELQSQIPTIHFFQNNKEAYGHFTKWGKYQKLREDRIIASTFPKCQTCDGQMSDIRLTSDGHVTDKCLTVAGRREVKGSKVKRSKENLHVDEQREQKITVYKRLEGEKLTPLYKVAYAYEDILHTRIVTWPKELAAIKKMFQAGYTESNILWTIRAMAKDDYWIERSFSLTQVAGQIAKYKALNERKNYENKE